ncbi:MAG: hypothetical protein K6G18_02095 [Treponema sp.]|nr:hypothetical protein [Treponema sp.]
MRSGLLKNFLYGCAVCIVACICFLGIPACFICSSSLSDRIGRYLHVDLSYTGGPVSAVLADDSGETEAQFDLVRCTVHQPVTGARWQQSAEYWQLVLDFAAPSQERSVIIYFDLDTVGGGSPASLFTATPEVQFDRKYLWDFALRASGDEGKVYDSMGDFVCNTENYHLNGGTQLKVRIPLQDKRVQEFLGVQTVSLYVLVCDSGGNSGAGVIQDTLGGRTDDVLFLPCAVSIRGE